MARGHDHGAARGARVLAQAHLHLQVVALVDHHVGARHEVGDGRLLHSPGIGHDADVRVELGHLAGSQDDLAHADVGEAAGHPIEVRQVEDVEVGEPQLAADALVRHRGHDRAPDRQAGDGHAEPRQALLLLRGDGVAVAVQAQLAVQGLGQDVHQPAAPRIEGPRAEALRLAALEHAFDRVAQRSAAELLTGDPALHELLDLLGERVDDDHGRIRDQLEEHGRGLGVPRVEQRRLEGRDVPPRRRGGELRCQRVTHGANRAHAATGRPAKAMAEAMAATVPDAGSPRSSRSASA